MTATRHRSLLDADTLVERCHAVAVISTALRGVDCWRKAGAAERDRAARRLAFAAWCARVGEINEADSFGVAGDAPVDRVRRACWEGLGEPVGIDDRTPRGEGI